LRSLVSEFFLSNAGQFANLCQNIPKNNRKRLARIGTSAGRLTEMKDDRIPSAKAAGMLTTDRLFAMFICDSALARCDWSPD
jgi:hypothetical protein